MAEGDVYKDEFRIIQPSGEVRFLRVQAQIFRDANGEFLRALGTNWDITPAREAEKKLLTERYLLRTLIDHLPEVVFIIDRDDHVMVANKALKAALEMPHDCELIKAKLHSYLPKEIGARLWDETVRVMESGEAMLNQVEKVILPDGEERWVRTSKIPWKSSQETIIGVICFSADITHEYQTQQKIQQQAALLAAVNKNLQAALDEAERQTLRAQASERAKAEFLAVMSHEIRTPMNSVLGMVRLALQTPLSDKQRNYLTKVDLSAKALVAVINDVLDFSKIEAGGMTLEVTEFSIENVLESVAAVLAVKAEEKGLELIFDVASDVPERLMGDSLRIGQVLINLVSNAVKFTERGEVLISIHREFCQSKDKSLLCFSVRDSGIGLNPGQIDRLFKPFTQADTDVSRRFGGTGLGLTICKNLVEMMNGSIHVESSPGIGSCFSFVIQVALPEQDHRSGEERKYRFDGQRLLIVDDNARASDALAQIMGRLGLQTAMAASGMECLRTLAMAADLGAPFDLVLIDWRMPGMNGMECLRKMKGHSMVKGTPAVLMVPSCVGEEVLQQAESAGFAAILSKPAIESDVVATLLDAFGHAHIPKGLSKRKKVHDSHLLKGCRALIADDSEINREVLRELLHKLGVVVHAEANGADVLECLRVDADFDFVLIDIEMEGMNGIDTAVQIRKDDRFNKLPILALTGHVDANSRMATKMAGMDGHLVKPIDFDVLQAELLRLRPAIPGQILMAGKRVLVVDDDELNRVVAGDFLIAASTEVGFAHNGQEVLEQLNAAHYDLVVMDLQMPVMNGIDTLRALRADERWVNMPVIILTAQAQVQERQACLELGVSTFLMKPLIEMLLYQAIRKHFSASPVYKSHVHGSDVKAEAEIEMILPTNLPGLDIVLALSLMDNDHESVIHFLHGFVRDFEGYPELVGKCLQTGSLKETGFLAHKVRSAAAYIGAQDLVNAAALVEQAVRVGWDDDMERYVTSFQRHIEMVLDTIRGAFSSDR